MGMTGYVVFSSVTTARADASIRRGARRRVTEVLVYATASRAQTARTLLGAACQATGMNVRLELYGSGSLYQRLGPRHAPPLPDVVLWFGPFAAQSAALDGLLQPYQPASVAPNAAHDASWRWTTLDYLPIGVVGST